MLISILKVKLIYYIYDYNKCYNITSVEQEIFRVAQFPTEFQRRTLRAVFGVWYVEDLRQTSDTTKELYTTEKCSHAWTLCNTKYRLSPSSGNIWQSGNL